MRSVFTNNSGGNLKNDVDYIKNYYKNNCLMKDIINVTNKLKIHNIVEQIKNIKKNYWFCNSYLNNNCILIIK